MKKIFSLTLYFFGFQCLVNAQDVVNLKNGQVLRVKIVEVSMTEIKYKTFNDIHSPIYTLGKDSISGFKYEIKNEEVQVKDKSDMEQYAGQRKQAFKVNLLSPLMGHSMFSIERNIKPGHSLEVSFSLIGAGKNMKLNYNSSISEKYINQKGIGVGAGYKFIKLPDYQKNKTRNNNIMEGFYVKPALYFGSFKENVHVYKSTEYILERQSIKFAAFQLELGRQWVLGNSFLFDIYGGVGLSYDDRKEDDWTGSLWGRTYNGIKPSSTSYNYMIRRVSENPGITFNGGVKFGVLF